MLEASAAMAAPRAAGAAGARRRGRAIRMAAAFALIASSAFLLLSSDNGGGGVGRSMVPNKLLKWGPSNFVRNLSDLDPILTNLARIGGTKSSSEAVACATTEADGNGVKAKSVTPIYWHIYKAGGTSVKAVLTFCLDLTAASEMGVLKGHDQDTEIMVMRAGGHKYVNVNTISWKGVDRAASMGLAESNLAEVVVTPIIHKVAADVFSPHHRALLFTVFRHPVDRLVSQYYYLQEASWEKTYNPDIAKETLGEYARKYDNRVLRQLIGKDIKWTAITQSDLDVAKEVVRTRMLVGLMSDVEGSMRRFIQYFGWEDRDDFNIDEYSKCMEEEFPKVDDREGFSGGDGASHGNYKSGNKHKHPKVEKGSPDWEEVAQVNKWDIELYDYILKVYEEQGRTMFDGVDTAAMRAASEAKMAVRAAAKVAADATEAKSIS